MLTHDPQDHNLCSEESTIQQEHEQNVKRTNYSGVPQSVPPSWDTVFGLADQGRILRWDT
jgi:hypothetical protein